MKKHTLLRVIIISVLGVVALAVAGFIVFKVINKTKDNKQPTAPVAPVQSADELKKMQQSSADFNVVALAANTKDYSRTVSLSFAYATNTANGIDSRLDAFRVCVQSAIKASDSSKKDACYLQGKTLAGTLQNQADKDFWLKRYDAIYNGTTQTTEASDDSNQ